MTKNRREARQPLRNSTALELGEAVAGRLPTAQALPLPKSFADKATRWLRHDLELAGIPYQDESGRYADFHALRAAFVSGLIRSGANAKQVQELARHSSAELTVGLYTKLGSDDEQRALAMLPELPAIAGETDGTLAQTGTNSVASSVAFPGDPGCPRVTSYDSAKCLEGPKKAVEGVESGGGGGSRTRVLESPLPGRLRV
jgi:hypothetical protein